jgi:hypothetical protein
MPDLWLGERQKQWDQIELGSSCITVCSTQEDRDFKQCSNASLKS